MERRPGKGKRRIGAVLETSIENRIIDYIKRHKVSSTEVADCMDKMGAIKGALPLNAGMHKVGLVQYVSAYGDSNWPIHDQVRKMPDDGRVVLVDDLNGGRRALFGELVSYYIIQEKKAEAIVTTGLMRDIAELIEGRVPMWCGGRSPEGCYNIEVNPTKEEAILSEANRERYQDGIAVCDDCGVVVIPKQMITEEMLHKLEAIEEQERIWFHCVRDLHWDTFDTVCLKKYKNDAQVEAGSVDGAEK